MEQKNKVDKENIITMQYRKRVLPLCPRCNHKHVLLSRKELQKTKFDGFVEWHNERTVNHIENPEECNCVLKNEWLNQLVPLDKCPYCNCPLHFDLLEGDYVL